MVGFVASARTGPLTASGSMADVIGLILGERSWLSSGTGGEWKLFRDWLQLLACRQVAMWIDGLGVNNNTLVDRRKLDSF